MLQGGFMMKEKNVVVYISDNSSHCEKLLKQLDKWDISYETKNVTENRSYMKELQKKGIYGTPATFIEDRSNAILGCQENKIKEALAEGYGS